jgi:hypothetical protein
MPIPKLDDLKDRTKYKKLLKVELQGVVASPTNWVLFDKFKFNDKVAPLLLVGDMANKVPFEAVKDTNAPIKGKGKCIRQGADVAFAADMGSAALDKLTDDLGGVSCIAVKDLRAPAAAGPADHQLQAAAEAKLKLSQQQFAAIKGRVSDDDRKAMHEAFGRVVDAMQGGNYGQAITEMKSAELLLARAGNLLRQDAQKKENSAAQNLENKAIAAAPNFEEATRLTKEVTELTAEIRKTETSKTVMDSRKGKDAQAKAIALGDKLKELNLTLSGLRAPLEEARKAKGVDQGEIKELEAKLKAAHDALALGKTVLATPGKLGDNPELLKAQQDISAKVGEMGAAVKWQQDQVKEAQVKNARDPVTNPEGKVKMHGTGRHGAQTGLSKQAQRVSSDVTPDQPKNEGGTASTPDQQKNKGGTASLTKTWRTHIIEIEETPQGKKKITVPAKLVKAVIGEMSRTFATATTSMFLNPVLEKEAVDRAMSIAEQAKHWAEWNKDGTWTALTKLAIVVPPPKTAKGYGLQMGRADGFVKKSAEAAAALIKEFDTGKIKSLDELFEKLNVQLATDETGVGAALIPHARVLLERTDADSSWSSKSHFPTPDAQGWDCEKGVTLSDKQVRGDKVPARLAGNYTP